jgi:hypothetical protein
MKSHTAQLESQSAGLLLYHGFQCDISLRSVAPASLTVVAQVAISMPEGWSSVVDMTSIDNPAESVRTHLSFQLIWPLCST